MVWRRRQQVREEVTGKLVPVEFELKRAVNVCTELQRIAGKLPDFLSVGQSGWVQSLALDDEAGSANTGSKDLGDK